MFKQALLLQWKWTRAALFALSVMAMIIPVFVMRLSVNETFNQTPAALIELTVILGATLAGLSVVTGVAIQNFAWNADISGRYVYALSLPVTWSRFVLHRTLASVILLALPALFLFMGSLIALSFVTLPDTLHGYAGGVAIRFFLGSLLSFAAWGLLLRLSGRRASLVLLVVLLVTLAIPFVAQGSGFVANGSQTLSWIADPPSPFAVYFSRWALIDV